MSISKSQSDVPGNGKLHPDHMPRSNLTNPPVGLQPSYVAHAVVPQPNFAHAQPVGYQPSSYITNLPVSALPPGFVAAPPGYANRPVGAARVPTKLYEEYPPYCCCYMNEHDPRCCVLGRDCNGLDPCPKLVVNLGNSCGKVTCGVFILLVIATIIIAIVLSPDDDKPATAQPTYAPYHQRY